MSYPKLDYLSEAPVFMLLKDRSSLDGFEKYLSSFHLRLNKLKQKDKESTLTMEESNEFNMLIQVNEWLNLYGEIEGNRS